MAKKQLVVKRYSSEKAYEKDANKMMKKGYVVESAQAAGEHKKGPGPAWLVGTEVEMVVTYRLADKA